MLLDPGVTHTDVNASTFDVKQIILECEGTEPLYHASKRPFKSVSGSHGMQTNLHRITKRAAMVMRPDIALDQEQDQELMRSGLRQEEWLLFFTKLIDKEQHKAAKIDTLSY